MSLHLAGELLGVQERGETVIYTPSLLDSGDLESATRSVTAASKGGVEDYAAGLTIVGPASSALAVLRAGVRVQVDIDSFGGAPAATRLSYSVEVEGVERATGEWTGTGSRYAAADVVAGQFNLDTATQVRVFLWVDQGEAVVSLCQVWLGVGTTSTAPVVVVRLSHVGALAMAARLRRTGSGTPYIYLTPEANPYLWYATAQGADSMLSVPMHGSVKEAVSLHGSVAADLNYIAYTAVNTISLV